MNVRTSPLSRFTATLGALAVVAALAPTPASALTADPKPLLIIMMDTSGSMEFTAGNAVSASVELEQPNCEPAGTAAPVLGKTYLKSRLIAAQEVLTGTFEDYWCRRDDRQVGYADEMDGVKWFPPFGYVLPHYDACSAANVAAGALTADCVRPRQKDNGLLDLRFADFKFALTTFHPYNPSNLDFNNMFSFGPDKDGGVNLGIRNSDWGTPNEADTYDTSTNAYTDNSNLRVTENVGRLIMPPVDDSLLAQTPFNIGAQREINRLRGFSATPLGPMLEDVKNLLETHETTQPPSGPDGDPYYECRPRVAILITDGRANPEGVHGYADTATALWALKNSDPVPVSVYVVGYNLQDDDASVLRQLDPDNGGPAEALLIADSPAELAAALAQITSAELQGRRSRTTTVYSNATRSSEDLQYQFNASYDADPNYPINQIGYLNQTVYRCNAGCAGVMSTGRSCAQDIYELHTRLNSRGEPRQILFHVDGNLTDLTVTTPAMIAPTILDMVNKFGLPTSGLLPQVEPASIGAGGIPVADPFATLGDVTDITAAGTYMNHLVRYLRADSGTMRCINAANPALCQRMGAIRRSTPVIQEPQVAGKYPMRSWNLYVNEPDNTSGYSPACRPTVLYTGTHDGLIHAFRVDNMQTAYGDCAAQTVPTQTNDRVGEELWAIMPQELLKRSHSLINNTAYLMDGALVVDEVLLTRADPENTDPADEAVNWRSVLTASYGRGGRGYLAMDVTNPLSINTVSVMWEIASSGHCRDGLCRNALNGDEYDFSLLGLSGSEAGYATAFLEGKEVAIALLPGGANVSGEALSGRVLYVVRLDTGEKLAEFRSGGANVVENGVSGGLMEFAITGSPAAYPNLPGSVASRAFVGDAGGRMWRINMVGAPDTWFMELFFDPYLASGPVPGNTAAREPVFGAPRLALTGDFGQVAVVYATGDIDLVNAAGNTRGGVFSFSEITLGDGTIQMQANWVKVLDDGESVTGEPEIFNRVAYWSTFARDANDACLGGEGWVYGVDYVQNSGGISLDNTVGQLDEDGDPSSVDMVKRKSTGAVVPFGVQVIERPACFAAGGNISAGGLGGAGAQGISRGAVELVVNVAEGQFSTPSTVPPGVDPANLKTPTITETLNDTGETVQSAAWGYVLY